MARATDDLEVSQLLARRSAEMAAVFMIGDGMLGLLQPRRHVALWRSLLPAEDAKPSAKARAVLEFMTASGASFFDGQGLLHGVTDLHPRNVRAAWRVTIVYYSTARLWACLPPTEELARAVTVKTKRAKDRVR